MLTLLDKLINWESFMLLHHVSTFFNRKWVYIGGSFPSNDVRLLETCRLTRSLGLAIGEDSGIIAEPQVEQMQCGENLIHWIICMIYVHVYIYRHHINVKYTWNTWIISCLWNRLTVTSSNFVGEMVVNMCTREMADPHCTRPRDGFVRRSLTCLLWKHGALHKTAILNDKWFLLALPFWATTQSSYWCGV